MTAPSHAVSSPGGSSRGGNTHVSPDRFGLLGLLSVIRMSDPDLTTLALGTDLTTLGLHLNSPENVYRTFASPWADAPLRPEPDFKVVSDPTALRPHRKTTTSSSISQKVPVLTPLQPC